MTINFSSKAIMDVLISRHAALYRGIVFDHCESLSVAGGGENFQMVFSIFNFGFHRTRMTSGMEHIHQIFEKDGKATREAKRALRRRQH
jgi:hypothetical protein